MKVLSHDLDALISSAIPPRGPIEAIDRILAYLRDGQASAASHVKLKENDHSIVYGRGPDELKYFLEEAAKLGTYGLTDNDRQHLGG